MGHCVICHSEKVFLELVRCWISKRFLLNDKGCIHINANSAVFAPSLRSLREIVFQLAASRSSTSSFGQFVRVLEEDLEFFGIRYAVVFDLDDRRWFTLRCQLEFHPLQLIVISILKGFNIGFEFRLVLLIGL